MGQLDTNNDGELSVAELQPAAGLASSLARLDRNGDGKLSRQELLLRLEKLAGMSDLLGPTVFVLQAGGALADADVEFRLDSWQGENLTALRGSTSTEGRCILKAERGSLPGIPKGFYTVLIATPGKTTPIERGCEVADDINSRELIFKLP